MPLGDVSSTYTDLVETVFSSTIAAKAWFATGGDRARRRAGADGIAHVGEAPERRSAVRSRTPRRVHLWSGRLAVLCTLPVFFHCVTILGFKTPDARVTIHSIAGSFVYGVLAAKLLVIRHRSRNYAHWVLPVLGGSLAAVLDDPVADLEPLVLHERPLRVLMRSAGQAVRAAARRRARRRSGSPSGIRSRLSAPAADDPSAGRRDPRGNGLRVELRGLSRRRCVGRRRAAAARAAGSTAEEVAAVVASGRGAMPAGIVTGQEAADVAAYVVSLSRVGSRSMEVRAEIVRLELARRS